MTAREARELFAYNRWANARFVEAVAALGDEQRRQRIESSFPSILETLAHVVGAEWVWLRRWLGENPTAFPPWLDGASFDQLRSRLATIEDEREAYLEDLEDGDLERELAYATLDVTPHRNRLADLFRHVVNHSSYHRGQLTTMLRQLGAVPPATDLVLYLRPDRG